MTDYTQRYVVTDPTLDQVHMMDCIKQVDPNALFEDSVAFPGYIACCIVLNAPDDPEPVAFSRYITPDGKIRQTIV